MVNANEWASELLGKCAFTVSWILNIQHSGDRNAIYSKTIRDLCRRRCPHKDYTSLEDGTHNSGLWTQHLLLLTSCRTKDAWPTFHLMLLLTQTSKQAQTIFVTFWRISDHLWQPYCFYIASGWVSTSLSTSRGKFLGILPVSVISSFSPLDAKSKVCWQFHRSTYVIQSHKQLYLCINGTFFGVRVNRHAAYLLCQWFVFVTRT